MLFFYLKIQCPDPKSDQQTIVHLADSSALSEGFSYRFCLVLMEQKNYKTEMVVGCSNFTRLTTSSTNKTPQTQSPVVKAVESQSVFIYILIFLIGVGAAVLFCKTRIRNYFQNTHSTQINAISEDLPPKEIANCNRYYKLQATTSL